MVEQKMKCPKCGGDLITQKFIDTWDPEGNPEEVNEYLVCQKCGVAWMDLDLETMKPYTGISWKDSLTIP